MSKSQLIRQGPDHIYYNVTIGNTTTTQIQAQFTDIRSEAIIEKPEDYYLSVIRFQVPTSAIPIFIMPVLTTTPPYTTKYSITLSYGGSDFVQPIIFVPSTNVSNPINFFGVFSYQQYLDMINTAFSTAFTALKTAFPGAPPTQPPKIFFDTNDKLLSIYVQSTYSGGGPGTIDIWMNILLFEFFESWKIFFAGFQQVNGKECRIIVDNSSSTLTPNPPGAGFPPSINPPSVPGEAYYQIKQEYNTLYLWNSLQKVVFTSGNIPIKYEYVPAQGSDGTSPNVASNFLPILTDFEPLLSNGTDVRSYLQYYPQGEYRLTDLRGNVPLNIFDISIYWEDFQSRLYPLFLDPDYALTIKFLFRKKTVKQGLTSY